MVLDEKAQKLYEKIDLDNSSSVSYSEFAATAIAQKTISTEENLRAAFNLFDFNKDDKISTGDLYSVLSKNDQGFTMDKAQSLISKFDDDEDGFIDFPEFKKMMKGSIAAQKKFGTM